MACDADLTPYERYDMMCFGPQAIVLGPYDLTKRPELYPSRSDSPKQSHSPGQANLKTSKEIDRVAQIHDNDLTALQQVSFNDYEQKFGKAREIATEIKLEYQKSLPPPKKDAVCEFLESHRDRLVAAKKVRPLKKQGFKSDHENDGTGESDGVEADIDGGESYDR